MAADGQEAVRWFKRRRDVVRLFIADGAMPVMNGQQAIDEIRALEPNLPVILISGEGNIAATGTGALIHLPKPFSLDELLTVVGGSLHKK